MLVTYFAHYKMLHLQFGNLFAIAKELPFETWMLFRKKVLVWLHLRPKMPHRGCTKSADFRVNAPFA